MFNTPPKARTFVELNVIKNIMEQFQYFQLLSKKVQQAEM